MVGITIDIERNEAPLAVPRSFTGRLAPGRLIPLLLNRHQILEDDAHDLAVHGKHNESVYSLSGIKKIRLGRRLQATISERRPAVIPDSVPVDI